MRIVLSICLLMIVVGVAIAFPPQAFQSQWMASIDAGGGAFSPSDLAGLEMWFDASDTDTVYTNTVESTSVITWLDRANTNRTAIRGNPRPVYTSDAVNGLSAMDFNASGQFMICVTNGTSGDSYPITISDNTFFSVYVRASAGIRSSGISGKPFTDPFWWRTDNKTYPIFDGNYRAADASTATGTFVNVVTITNATVDSMVYRRNQVALSLGSKLSLMGGLTLYKVGGAGGVDHDGFLCEVIAYDRKLSDADIVTVEEYLIDKWGITIP